MFLIRHELITARTLAAQTDDVCARIGALDRWVPEQSRALARGLADQLDRVRWRTASAVLFGVIAAAGARASVFRKVPAARPMPPWRGGEEA